MNMSTFAGLLNDLVRGRVVIFSLIRGDDFLFGMVVAIVFGAAVRCCLLPYDMYLPLGRYLVVLVVWWGGQDVVRPWSGVWPGGFKRAPGLGQILSCSASASAKDCALPPATAACLIQPCNISR